MKLVYTATQKPVTIGDIVQLRDGEAVVSSIQAPHKPSSTGRVYVKPHGAQFSQGYFPGVIGAEWINRGDQ